MKITDSVRKGGLLISTMLLCACFINVLLTDDSIVNGSAETKIYYLIFSGLLFVTWHVIYKAFLFNGWIVGLNAIDYALIAFILFIEVNSLVKFNVVGLNHLLIFTSLAAYCAGKSLLKDSVGRVNVRYICLIIFTIIAIILGIKGVSQIWTGNKTAGAFNLTGYFGNPGIYGTFLSATFAVSLGIYFLIKDSRILKVLSALNILLVLLVLPSTQSRAAWISALVGAGFVLINEPQVNRLLKKYKAVTVGICIISIALIPKLYKFKEASAFGRTLIWKVSSQMIKDNLITGVGFDRFQYKYPDYQYSYFKHGDPTENEILVNDTTHYTFNDPLQILVENGIVGFMLFASLIYALVISFKSTKDPLFVSAYAGISSIGVSSMFSYPFEVSSIWWVFIFLLSLISALVASKQSNIRISRSATILIALITLVSSVFLFVRQTRNYKTMQSLLMADDELEANSYSEALKLYHKVNLEMPNNIPAMLGYGKCLLLLGRYNESEKILLKASNYISDPFLSINLAEIYVHKKQYGQAENQYNRAIYMLPNRVYSRYLLMKMLAQNNDSAKAVQVASYISSMRIKVKSEAIDEMVDEANDIIHKLKPQN